MALTKRWKQHIELWQNSGLTQADVATLNRTHSLKYVKEGVCKNESRKTESLYG